MSLSTPQMYSLCVAQKLQRWSSISMCTTRITSGLFCSSSDVFWWRCVCGLPNVCCAIWLCVEQSDGEAKHADGAHCPFCSTLSSAFGNSGLVELFHSMPSSLVELHSILSQGALEEALFFFVITLGKKYHNEVMSSFIHVWPQDQCKGCLQTYLICSFPHAAFCNSFSFLPANQC